MKKTLLFAAVLVLAGCGEKKAAQTPADTTAAAPAPAMSDSGMKHDSMPADTSKKAM